MPRKRKAKPMQTATALSADTAPMMVPDPGEDARYRRIAASRHKDGVTSFREPLVQATRALRDDPLGQMHARRQIGEAQYRAGREWQRVHEQAGVGRLRSSGDIREPVDGGQIANDGITDMQLAAMKKLAAWERRLGTAGNRIVVAVLAHKRSIRDVADTSGLMPGKAATTFMGHRFRECLSTLAKAMGYVN